MNIKDMNLAIEKSKNELAKLCSELIKIPTPNPPGITSECALYMKDYFDGVGVPSQIISQGPGKDNIIVKIQGRSENTIIWNGHIDVVPEGDPLTWKDMPYSGLITDDGRIYGRGSSDMKGSCASAMLAARFLHKIEKELPNDIEFWFTCDEETGGPDGAPRFAKEGHIKGDVLICGDSPSLSPSRTAINVAEKGSMRPRIIAKGITAHGSKPYLGDNAIDKLISLVPHVKRIEEYRLKMPVELDPVIKSTIEFIMIELDLKEEMRETIQRSFYYPTISLTLIEGGVKENVVPDKAEATFDVRVSAGGSRDAVFEKICEIVDESGIEDVKVVMSDRHRGIAGCYEPSNSHFVNQLSEAITIATGISPIKKMTTGGTDAAFIKNDTGIPSVNVGAGVNGQYHAPNEYVTINNLVMAAKIYAIFPMIYTKPS